MKIGVIKNNVWPVISYQHVLDYNSKINAWCKLYLENISLRQAKLVYGYLQTFNIVIIIWLIIFNMINPSKFY